MDAVCCRVMLTVSQAHRCLLVVVACLVLCCWSLTHARQALCSSALPAFPVLSGISDGRRVGSFDDVQELKGKD